MNWLKYFSAVFFICSSKLVWADELITISPGQEVQKKIARGETQRYQVPLSQGTFQIVVKPSFFDVAVIVRQADGQQILRANSPPTEIGDEYLVLTIDTPDEYIIEIQGVEQSFSHGNYVLLVTEPTFSKEQLAAAALTTAAAQVVIDETTIDRGDALKKALELYGLSATAWGELDNAKQQSRSLGYHGWLALELGQLKTAQSSFTKALELVPEKGIDQAWMHAYLGFVQLEQDQLGLAKNSLQVALTLSRMVGDERSTASFLSYLGLISQYQNLPVSAAKWYTQALTVLEGVGYPHQEAITLSNIGGTHYQIGRFEQALEYYKRALKIHQHDNDLDEQATVLGNIASLYRDQGDLGLSLDYNLRTLEIYKGIGDIQGQNLVYHRLGILFQRMGDYQRSEVYFLRAFKSRKHSKSLRRAASSLRSLGAMYTEQGVVEKALKVQNEALSIYTQIDRTTDIARTEVAIAGNLIKQNKLKEAKALLNHALPILKEASLMPDVADGLLQLGRYNAIKLNIDAAKSNFNETVDIQRKVSDPIGEVNTLVELARLETNPKKSLTQLNSAEVIANRIHQSIGNPALKARFSATLQNLYDSLIEAHLALDKIEPDVGHMESAFMASERNRARSLLELISNSKIGSTASQSKLLEKQKQLRRNLNALWFGVNKPMLSSNNPEAVELRASNEDAMVDIMSQLDNLASQLSESHLSPSEIDSVSINDLQQALSSDELLLHIHLGKNQGAIWSISNTQVSIKDLPANSIIEKSARSAYDTLLRNKFSNSDKETLSNLSKLLIKDTSIFANKRHVYVVADGSLQYIPFGALLDDAGNFLVESATFLNLPSSRTLLHREQVKLFAKDTSMVVYSDPVFGEADFRAQAIKDTSILDSTLSRAVTSAELNRIKRLPFSTIEANQIVEIVPSAIVVSGYAANKQNLFNRSFKETDILHFATHGIVNDNYPALSGLVLSLVDKDKNQRDGFLSAADISTLAMNPKLVVLSACETGIGEVIPGEGLLSLARVFLGQGAENVVSSLWQVNDQATAELMGHFYHALIEQGYSITQALQYAQRKIAAQPQWRAPYYWAGFITSSASP